MAAKKLKKNSLLWKITNTDTGIDSYIYGTIHLKDQRLYFLMDKVEELIKTCDVFMAEYSLDDAGDESILQKMYLNDGRTLRSYIPEKKFLKLEKIIKKSFGIDLKLMENMKPMIIENMIIESLFQNDYNAPMDMILWNFAKENGLETVGAETTISQIKILDKIPIKPQIKSLIKLGKNPNHFKKNITKLIGYYLNQDIGKLHKNSVKSLGKLKKLLVYNRNDYIVASIEKYCSEKSVFVAVGAGHLSGEKGILRKLKNRGYYKVVPVSVGE